MGNIHHVPQSELHEREGAPGVMVHHAPAFRFVVSRALWATRLGRIVVFEGNGYRLRFYPTALSATLWCNRRFLARDEAVLREVLRPGDTFVDVGANIGALSLLGSKLVGASGGVYAIEAHPRTATFLAGNIRLNGARNVQVIQAAAGDRDSETRVTSRRSDDQNAVSDEGVKVPMRRLDSLLPDIDVRLMKLDVEGFELFALRGAERVLRRTQFVYFESWQQHSSKFGYRTPELTAFLKGCGFQLDCAEDYVSEQCENLLAQRPLHCESRK